MDDVLERTRSLVAERNRIDAALARTVREAETAGAFQRDGMATAQSWLRGHCRLSGPAAAQVVRNGRAVEQLPAVAAAHAAGEISADAVSVIGKITAPRYLRLIEQQTGDLAGIAEVMVDHAVTRKHDELVTLVHTFLDRLDEDGPEPDPTEQRRLMLVKHADGSSTGRFDLDPMGTEKLSAALESILQTNRPAGDERTLAQRRADALVQLADIHLGCGTLPMLRTVKPHVAVRVDLDDLIDPATGKASATLGMGAVISAARARWAACDADLARYVLAPDGALLDLGHRPRCRDPRRACEAWGAAGSFHSPAATPRRGGARSITSCTGCSAARRRWPTPRCSANATTPRSTTASPSPATTRAAGTPTAPTAPRSWCSGHPPTTPTSPAPAEQVLHVTVPAYGEGVTV